MGSSEGGIVTRPGVAGAVLQTPPLLIQVSKASFVKISSTNLHSQTVRVRVSVINGLVLKKMHFFLSYSYFSKFWLYFCVTSNHYGLNKVVNMFNSVSLCEFLLNWLLGRWQLISSKWQVVSKNRNALSFLNE